MSFVNSAIEPSLEESVGASTGETEEFEGTGETAEGAEEIAEEPEESEVDTETFEIAFVKVD